MKCFQVMDGFVHCDVTNMYPSVADIPDGTFAPNMQFVNAPDHVFENWGYDEGAEGDARFIQPTPPEGFLYDPETGRFVLENPPPEPEPEPDPAVQEILDIIMGVTD